MNPDPTPARRRRLALVVAAAALTVAGGAGVAHAAASSAAESPTETGWAVVSGESAPAEATAGTDDCPEADQR